MPSWSRIIYGTDNSNSFIHELFDSLFNQHPGGDSYQTLLTINDHFEVQFREISKQLVMTVGVDVIRERNRNQYMTCKTEFGPREIVPLRMEFMGDEYDPEEYVGFGLTSRYFPSLLDFKSPYGGMEALIMEDYIDYQKRIVEAINGLHPLFSELSIKHITDFS